MSTTTQEQCKVWLDRLVKEFAQTERSAAEHPVKEAKRLGDVPPALALLSVADHAEDSREMFERLVGEEETKVGDWVGHAFSVLRDTMGDQVLTFDRSYRGTLLGMTHGLDLAHVMLPLAARVRPELEDFLSDWIATRTPLVEACREQLSWFVSHPECGDAYVAQGWIAKAKRAVL